MMGISDFIKKEINREEFLYKIYRDKMKQLISDTLKEAIEGLIKSDKGTPKLMESLNKELIKAIKVIFKEDLIVKTSQKDDKVYMGFYLDDELVFEYGYYLD